MTVDLGDLTLGTDWPATIRMLIVQKRCFLNCLLSIEEEAEKCTCSRCGNRLHGIAAHLLDQPVDAPRRVVPRLPGEHPDVLFDPDVPEPVGATP